VSGFSINQVAISGNLTRDPELRSLPTGTSVCELGVAVNERVKSGDNWVDRANFFDVTVWSGLGEWVAQNMGKGDGIAVAGRLRYESWEKDGQKRSKVKIVAESIMPRRESGGGNSSHSDIPHDEPAATPVTATASDDDIPF
jgi:single-strand DNA-binding protein